MIYKVTVRSLKGHTSDHEFEADSPDSAIELALETIPFEVREVWCEDIYETL